MHLVVEGLGKVCCGRLVWIDSDVWCVAIDQPVHAEAEQTDDQKVEDQVADEGEQGFVSQGFDVSQGCGAGT